jgi:hypothetical protein
LSKSIYYITLHFANNLIIINSWYYYRCFCSLNGFSFDKFLF